MADHPRGAPTPTRAELSTTTGVPPQDQEAARKGHEETREAFPELDAYEGNIQKPNMQETREAGTAERRAQLAEERKGELQGIDQ
ncbi:hypothetical protein KFL_000980350 [Klebsormidium nitens]|uniref:Uncharacterized protein n=1 Tax=Klebsormidium nitens TaxID=105231 RepID=A0A0U9HLB4_KLENI|nr:hypothetical protein KFL_000980350 [Klebsormidium nitens]|eukprot:GAQ82048.1 hypothetical protein KFL_000980350 [Klebsormidium nitens]